MHKENNDNEKLDDDMKAHLMKLMKMISVIVLWTEIQCMMTYI